MTLPNLLTNKSAASLAHKIVSSEQVRCFEAAAAKEVGCGLYALMQRAGAAAFDTLCQYWPKAKNILVIVGNGNNAGDGYVLATLAKESGLEVTLACENPDRILKSTAEQAQKSWLDAGGVAVSFESIELRDFDLVVDALLGTGIIGEVKPVFRNIIRDVNHANLPILSIDIPSGMQADTGIAIPECIHATVTLGLVALKPGLVTGKAKHECGILEFDDLGIGKAFFELVSPQGQVVDWKILKPLGSRAIHANKGSFGKLLCIGGNLGMSGAIRLSAEAALRSGAGLVKVYCHELSAPLVSAGRPELMVSSSDLKQALDWCTSIVIGPGLGTNQWGAEQFKTLIDYIKQHPKPLVIDADGLNLLAIADQATKEIISELPSCVLTPHPGEASRLLNLSIIEVESDRYNSCKNIALTFNAMSLLKGAGTVMCSASHRDSADPFYWICSGGNPGMATAGMGDLLTGVIGAFLAQGMPLEQGVVYGVSAHAEAGDKVASTYGQRGMMASDLLPALRATINNL